MYEPSKLFTEEKTVEVATPKTFTPDLDGLIAWLETQDGARVYDHWSIEDCLICRFVTAVKQQPYRFSRAYDVLHDAGTIGQISHVAYNGACGVTIHTYADALSRARAAAVSK